MSIATEIKRSNLSQVDVDERFKQLVTQYVKQVIQSRPAEKAPLRLVPQRTGNPKRKKGQLKPSEFFLVMKGTLHQRGWTQGTLKDAGGKMCIRGVMVYLYHQNLLHEDDADRIGAYLRVEVQKRPGGGSDQWNFIHYNNDPRRTFADIVRLLEICHSRAMLAGE